MVGCTTAINATLNSDLTELPRLPGEDVCLPCERGKVAGQAPGSPGLCWWIWRPVDLSILSWNHSSSGSSGRMSWISGMILDYLEGGSSMIKLPTPSWLMVFATHVYLLENFLISQYVPFQMVIFQPLFYPQIHLLFPRPPVMCKKDGMRACTACPLGECLGSIHPGQPKLVDFSFQDSFICFIIYCTF